jgi:hypothetical protein
MATSFSKYIMKSNQIDKPMENESNNNAYNTKTKPPTSIFNKIAGASKKSINEVTYQKIFTNRTSNPYNLKPMKSSSVFETTVEDNVKFSKFNSNGKIASNYPPAIPQVSSSKNKIGLSKYSHVFGDIEDRSLSSKFDTTRSAASTRAGKFSSNKIILGVNPASNIDDVNSPAYKHKKVISMLNQPFSKIV